MSKTACALVSFANEGSQLRVITDAQGEPWFVATDLCSYLAPRRTSDALGRLDDIRELT